MIATALVEATRLLGAAGVDSPAREARMLMAHALGISRGTPFDPAMATPAVFWPLVERRRAREPMALIVGRQGFWTLDLAVSSATLIPRPDTESLIESLIEERRDRTSVRRILDLGTGTGALLLAALSEFPEAVGVGVDRVLSACCLARRNALANGLAGWALILCGDWAHALTGKFDVVLANPPYIETARIPGLMPEVSVHEPPVALDGGADGLGAYRRIIPTLPRLLAPGGIAVLELGAGQSADVRALAEGAGLAQSSCKVDFGGVPRALALCARGMGCGCAKKQVGIRKKDD